MQGRENRNTENINNIKIIRETEDANEEKSKMQKYFTVKGIEYKYAKEKREKNIYAGKCTQ